MTPLLVVLACAVVILGLFLLNRDRQAKTSPALWLPVVWLAIGGSRNVTQWSDAAPAADLPRQYLEGSPLDRDIFTGLILISLVVLIRRAPRTRDLLKRNAPILLFFLFCAVSAAWSRSTRAPTKGTAMDFPASLYRPHSSSPVRA